MVYYCFTHIMPFRSQVSREAFFFAWSDVKNRVKKNTNGSDQKWDSAPFSNTAIKIPRKAPWSHQQLLLIFHAPSPVQLRLNLGQVRSFHQNFQDHWFFCRNLDQFNAFMSWLCLLLISKLPALCWKTTIHWTPTSPLDHFFLISTSHFLVDLNDWAINHNSLIRGVILRVNLNVPGVTQHCTTRPARYTRLTRFCYGDLQTLHRRCLKMEAQNSGGLKKALRNMVVYNDWLRLATVFDDFGRGDMVEDWFFGMN